MLLHILPGDRVHLYRGRERQWLGQTHDKHIVGELRVAVVDIDWLLVYGYRVPLWLACCTQYLRGCTSLAYT